MGQPFRVWLEQNLRRREMTQADLAQRIGTSRGTVSRWMSGESIPDTRSCDLISEALLVGVDDVLSAAGHRPRDLRATEPGEQLAAALKRIKWDARRRGMMEAIIRQWADEDRQAKRQN